MLLGFARISQSFCDLCVEKHTKKNNVTKMHMLKKHHQKVPKENSKPKTLCDMCKEDGEEISAAGHCLYFNEYLCSSCRVAHKKTRLTNTHIFEKIPEGIVFIVESHEIIATSPTPALVQEEAEDMTEIQAGPSQEDVEDVDETPCCSFPGSD